MSNPFSAKKPDSSSGAPADEVAQSDKASSIKPAPEVESVPTQEGKKAEAEQPQDPRPALGMDEISCRTCRYLDFKGDSRTAASGGECRRNAPVPGANQLASWPRVTWEGWCGEWKSGVSDEDMVKMARAIADEQAEGPAGGFRKSAPPKSGT